MSRRCGGDPYYIIYHIKGEKVGRTRNVTARKAAYRHSSGRVRPSAEVLDQKFGTAFFMCYNESVVPKFLNAAQKCST